MYMSRFYFKCLSPWRRRRRDCRDWSVAATRATRETRETKKMACAFTKETSRRRLQTRWQPWFARKTRRRLRDVFSVAATSPAVSVVSSRSRRRHGDVMDMISLRNWWRRRGDVSETCWRLEKSPKSLQKNRTSLNFPRLPGDWASLQETSRRRLCNQRRL